MKYIVLTMLLAVVQTLPPVPRKATNGTDGVAQNVKKDSNSDQAPAAIPPTTINPIAPNPEQGTGDAPSSKDTEQSIRVRELPSMSMRRDWADWVLWVFNGLLVIAGFLGIRVACKTLKTLERQARSTHHQAVQVRKQTGLLNKSAEAALLNAQAVINSERAWIDGEIIHKKQLNIHTYSLNISNHGKTPAKLLSYEIRWGYEIEDQSISPESLTSNGPEMLNRLFGTNGSSRIGDSFRIDSMFSEEPETSEMETKILWTTILYQDVVGGNEVHKTTFVYRCRPLLDILERRSVYDDYT